jgi:sialate O-acetylesterase
MIRIMTQYASLLIFFLLNILSIVGFTEIRLPAILGSHMVLQQQTNIKLWGWCEPGEKISIKVGWDTTTYTTIGNSNAKWVVNVKTNEAGGPYKINLSGYNKIELEDVVIGEVWLCSGQSNMEMSFNWGLKQYSSDFDNATNKSIRFFHIPRLTADNPQEDTKARWVVCNPEDAKRFSLVGYFFGKNIQQNLNVPVGLINASWGGTPAETWTPKEVVENDIELKKAAANLIPSSGWPITPSVTYNAMIYPLVNFNIAGVIWYQGEANVGASQTYQSLFTSMIGSWRKAWQKDFPFYYVQIAPFAGYGNNNVSALLRVAQTKSLSYPKTGMVVISDLVKDINDIHPQMKKEVGRRLADYALADNYRKRGIVYKSPLYKSMKIEKDQIRIFFENADNGLLVKGGAATEFYIAADDKKFMPAEVKIEKNSVLVFNKLIKHPVAVRFAFSNSAMPNLFSKEGLPVNLFRTDDWMVNTDAVKK